MRWTRRHLLKTTAASLGAAPLLPLLSGCASDDAGDDEPGPAPLPTYDHTGPLGPEGMFAHGVASGDPLSDRVILWTRVSLTAQAAAAGAAQVFWEVAEDPAFAGRVAAGTAEAGAAADWTVKVDAAGLKPGQTYYYRFWLEGRSSAIGRTRTLPVGSLERLRLAVCSCANFRSGYYVNYRDMAAYADLAAVLHLGDYIYEYGGDLEHERYVAPNHECLSLDDYRARYAGHRADVDLQAAHRQHPFICVWDDHETANNASSEGAPKHDEATQGPWAARRAAALQAWREWLPVRTGEDGKIWRSFVFGDLAELWMLDTRLWNRAKQTTPSNKAALADPARHLLGPDQEAWLFDGLTSSLARWRLLGQQVMVARLGVGATVLNTDQWDGYQACRDRLYAKVRETGVGDFVVLTGDIHSSWANDLVEDSSDAAAYDPSTGVGALGVEFVVPGISSSGLPGGAGPEVGNLAREFNPHIRWNDVQRRGWGLLDVAPERVTMSWRHAEEVDTADRAVAFAAAWTTAHGSGHLAPADAEPAAIADAPPLAP
jgi:alkaline phosphatase D